MLHPTINYWPDQDADLLSSTSLPFLEWHQGNCETIVDDLRKEWSFYVSAYPKRLTFREEKTVTRVAQTGSKYRLWFNSGLDPEYVFDVVIATVGFNDEHSYDGFPTPQYWDPDGLDTKLEDPSKPYFAVSGAGDGGLIDALRSLYRFDKGALAFRIAELLQDTAVNDHIKAAEKLLKESVKANNLTDDDAAEIIRLYRLASTDFLESEPCPVALRFVDCRETRVCSTDRKYACRLAHARQLLDQSERSSRALFLVDRDISNLALSKAAPIHKFLVQLALEKGRAQFEQGTLQPGGTCGVIQGRSGGVIEIPDNSEVYARHGADTNFKQVVNAEDKDLFHAGREWLSDFNVGRHFSDSDFYHPRYEISPESEELRPEIRRDRASSALAKLDEQENEDGNRWLTVESSEETGKVQFAYYGKRVSFGLPNNRLFGVDIAYKGDPERNPDTLRATWMP